MGKVMMRKKGQAIRVGEAIVTILDAHKGQATLEISAPPHVRIDDIGRGPHRVVVPVPDSGDGDDEDGLTPLPQAA